MKKLLTLLLAGGMVFSSFNSVSAVEVKVSGEWLASFTFADNLFGVDALNKHRSAQDGSKGGFNAAQRVRVNFDLVASEALSGRVQLQATAGNSAANYYSWGQAGVGGPGESVTARLAYLDWLIPSTDVQVRMGRQVVNTPSYTFGSPILDDAIDGIMVNAPINDMVGVTFGWMRPFAEVNKWGVEHYPHTSVDLAYLAVDVVSEGFRVTPWGMIGLHGNGDGTATPGSMDMMGYGNAGDARSTVYWVGIGGELGLFDPFRITGDFIYSGNDADGDAERRGWYAALGAEMDMAFATPFLKGWYASGDDADSNRSGRLLSVDEAGAFDASSIYFDGNDLLAATIDNCNPAGTWGLQLGAKNISFIEDLTHALSVSYFQGTNNTNRITDAALRAQIGTLANPATYMTTSDSAWEVDFLSSYQLYQNLTANLLLAYMITDFDESVWGTDYDNGFRGTLNFTYAF